MEWLEVKEWAEKELETARESIEQPFASQSRRDHEAGVIYALKLLLDLPNAGMPQDDESDLG